MRARRIVLVALVLALAPTSAAYADDGPDDGGAFNPVLTDSPITVYICSVPGACVIGGPK